MIIRGLLIKIAVLAVLLLTAIRGHLLYFVGKYGSVVFYVPTATESTPLNNKDTTPMTESKPVSRILPANTASSYKLDNPSDMIHDIQRGKIGCDELSLKTWIELVTMAMVSQDLPQLNVDINHKGGVYSFHHYIKVIKPPADTQAVLENMH